MHVPCSRALVMQPNSSVRRCTFWRSHLAGRGDCTMCCAESRLSAAAALSYVLMSWLCSCLPVNKSDSSYRVAVAELHCDITQLAGTRVNPLKRMWQAFEPMVPIKVHVLEGQPLFDCRTIIGARMYHVRRQSTPPMQQIVLHHALTCVSCLLDQLCSSGVACTARCGDFIRAVQPMHYPA